MIAHILWSSLHGAVVLHLAGKLSGEVSLHALLDETRRVLRDAFMVKMPA